MRDRWWIVVMRWRQLGRGGRGWGRFSQMGSVLAAWVGIGVRTRKRKRMKKLVRERVVGILLLEGKEEDGEMAIPLPRSIIVELNEVLSSKSSSWRAKEASFRSSGWGRGSLLRYKNS